MSVEEDRNKQLLTEALKFRVEGGAKGIPSEVLSSLARRISENIPDFDTALQEIRRAVEVAARAQTSSPASDSVGDEVLARVASLNGEGNYTEGVAEIDAALALEEAQSKMRQIRLLDAGIEQELLRRNPEGVARRLIRRLELELPAGEPLFRELNSVQREWYERGRDKGSNFDLEVAIALARLTHAWAAIEDEGGAALNNLGIALATLGKREPGTTRLEEAVAAYRLALEELIRDRVPLSWAGAHMNLGTALQTLGEREPGIARLEEAVTAYRLALEALPRERVPVLWAKAQVNLGTALQSFGEREPGTARLEEAVATYRLALGELTRERVPLDWATAQMNLGNALMTLGERELGTTRLEEAVAVYRLALEELTRDRVPLDWATAQMNLGNALRVLGGREPSTARLENSVTAYRLALEEWTRERVPFDWAKTQLNLASLNLAYYDKTGDPAHLDAADSHFAAWREVFGPAGVHFAEADTVAAEIARRRNG